MKTKLFTVPALLVGASAWAADPAPEEKTGLKVGVKAPAFTHNVIIEGATHTSC